ncbi:MAG: ATP-binding cassette domain-containing protein [Pirellulaceae bacterium]|nr:ATP-binding cassette domain-containing protein [Pirellulaceae bacterium]
MMLKLKSRSGNVTPIGVQRLTVRYSGLVALDDVSIQFETGRSYAVVGQSGCGKSTLLRAICGLVEPTAGQIRLGDNVVSSKTISQLRQYIGYVIQEGGLFPHMNAWQNVTLMARHVGWSKSAVEQRVNELSEIAQLTSDQLGRYPSELSGGQRQRVGLMRALMLDPDVLLMDEPLGALDPIIRRRLQDDLKQIIGRLKKTVILVTHDLSEAAWLSDQIILMSEGRIVQCGTLAEIGTQPASQFVRDFVRAQRPLELHGAQP